MHALLPLLAVVAATATATATAALPPPTLLVLRTACLARDSTAFTPPAHFERQVHHPLRVLSYEGTCGPGSSVTVAQESLGVMSGGGTVAVAGWPGAAVCDALTAAARALRRPRPEVCSLPAARAAAVVWLADKLGWRRAILPPASVRSECHAALQELDRALTAAAVTTVKAAPIFTDELTLLSHVVILCASRGPSAGGESDGPLAAAAGAVLLLHVDEPAAAETAVTVTPSALADDVSRLSNNDFRVNKVSYISSSEKSSVHMMEASGRTSRRKFDFRLMSSKNINISRMRRGTVRETVHDSVRDAHIARNSKLVAHHKNSSRTKIRSVESRSASLRVLRPDYIFSFIDENFPRGNLLLLSDHRLDEDRPVRDLEYTYAEALETVERAMNAEKERAEVAEFTFHLYRRPEVEDADAVPSWRHVGSLATRSTRSLDDASEWETGVRAANGSDAFERLNETPFGDGRLVPNSAGMGAGTGAAWLSAAAGVALAAAAALALRWVAARRRRRRRGGDAVLAPAHFSFPADERRCVGEGMETMLSCWLQQLHEFGGPELERPDILKQPPRVPSAPSSTCSVNRIALDRRIRYKGDAVHLKPLETAAGATEMALTGAGGEAGGSVGGGAPLELKRKAIDVLLLLQNLRHENLNPFIGCLCEVRPALVWDHCGRGSLEDVLMADDIKLDWTFRLSLLTDLVKGMRYLHASPLRVHGRLSSRNCVVDSRWVLRVTDYGLPALRRAQQAPAPPRAARDLLWTAPELLRDTTARARGSQSGDVYSFAIVMQEVIVRGEPYCMLSLTPDELVEKLSRPPPLIRPSVSMGAAPPEAVSVMRQCWSEAPDMRPDFHRLHDLFRHLHRGRKINIVDSMFEMLEKYSNNLEELIKERTEQLDMEKKKTEQLLNRMLPRSVAERLLLGSRVEPEEFSEVSIYFSDIVGFTALAARSTPVQVVDLLNDLYTTFDAAIERYRVYKVETIGDAYMVVGGLPARAVDHAESVATMALHLLHLAGCFRVRHLPDTPLHLRIGLHSGPCCAAVVGLTMPRYCLFGDTVNTASRMESTGAAWRIQVSAATAERLAAAGGFRLRSRGLVMIKGKGAMHTYWLLGKDGFDKLLPVPPPLESEEVLFETDAENESETSSGPPSACAPAPPSLAVPASPAAGASSRAPLGMSSPTTAVPASAPFELRLNSNGAVDHSDKGRERSGAVSADSSPPGVGVGAGASVGCGVARMVSTLSMDRPTAPYARYRWAGGGAGASTARALRRQWSLETPAVERVAGRAPSPPPLALLTTSGRAPPPRYRTRPEPPDELPAPAAPPPAPAPAHSP